MSWLTILLVAAVVAALAAMTGAKPSGTRHVARTHLMSVARVVLLVAILAVLFFVLRAPKG